MRSAENDGICAVCTKAYLEGDRVSFVGNGTRDKIRHDSCVYADKLRTRRLNIY